MSRIWFRQRERGSPFAIRIILWVAQNLGRGSARLLLYPITLYFLLFAGSARRASRRYLTRVFGQRASLWQVARHIHTFAATILDRVFFLSGRFELFDIRVHGAEAVTAWAEQGRGCLLFGSHLGSFEALRAIAVEHKRVRVKVLMYPSHNEYLTGLLNAINPEVARTVIPLGRPDSLLRVKEALDEGNMVGVLADRVAESDKVAECDFLGSPAAFPTGPALLASVLEVPVVQVFALYRGGNRYDLHFEPLAQRIEAGRKEREQVLARWTQRYADRLAAQARKAPYNWFNFYDFWDEN
ncbi:MAG: lipid A biosynthesis acyltransferase [Pseudomonadota bacterium]